MSSPQTPRHSRQSSAIDAFPDSPGFRRSSNGPASPYRGSFSRQDTHDMSELGVSATSGNGTGNLADELADAFSESEEEYHGGIEDGADVTEDVSIISSGEAHQVASDGGLHVPATKDRSNHKRRESAYDGSEYGSETDLDSSGLPPNLVARIDAVESLARRGIENYGGPADDIVKRVTESLRDLGSQSTIEGSASRLITAHSALTTHLAHQTRQVHSLSLPILSPMAPTPDSEAIEELIPLLVALSEEMPRPSTAALDSLATLHSHTAELVQTLNYLADTLHMSRQTTSTAARRLKSAKELVADMRREEELREEGERWLTKGNWGERLQNRECAGVCGDVVGGFEEVCNGWRERLLAQAEAQA